MRGSDGSLERWLQSIGMLVLFLLCLGLAPALPVVFLLWWTGRVVWNAMK